MFENLNPYDKSTAVMEILIMLLVAFIIGFVIAWLWRKSTEKQTLTKYIFLSDYQKLEKEHKALQEQHQQLQASASKAQNIPQPSDEYKGKFETLSSEHASLKAEYDKLLAKMQNSTNANNGLDEQIEKLTTENKHLQEEIDTLQRRFDEAKAQLNPERARVTVADLGIMVASADDKDDLKRIKGVGPFIEEKLNDIGIYTFEQVSTFTPELADKVTDAIEFFPGRIQRDNWMGQAKELFEEKKKEQEKK